MSKQLAILGDLHGKVSLINDLIDERPYIKTVIQVGDLGLFYSEGAARQDKDWKRYKNTLKDTLEYKPKMKRQVHFIKGNHEDFEMLESPLLNDLNFYYIAQGSVKNFQGYKIGFLGGIYSPKKIKWNPSELKGRQKRFYTKEDIQTLKNNAKDGLDILITHEGPAKYIHIEDYPHNRGTKVIYDLMDELRPKYHIHGHHHYNYSAEHKGTKIIGLGNLKHNEHSFKLI